MLSIQKRRLPIEVNPESFLSNFRGSLQIKDRLFIFFYSLDSLVVSIENFRTPKFTPKVNLRSFNGRLSAKTSFIAACIFPSVSLFGKIPCSFASSFTLSMVLANLRSLVNVSMMAMVVAVAIGDFRGGQNF